MPINRKLSFVIIACLTALALPFSTRADSLKINVSATYWVLAENDQDTGPTKCCFTVTDMVLSELGPDGLPLVNPKYVANGDIKDVNNSGEITWWSPAFNPNVSFLSSGTTSLPLASFEYPPSGNDLGGFLVAEFQGVFSLPNAAKITFTTISDDDSLVYLDGKLVLANGGVKNLATVSGTDSLSAGQHSLALFYADRDPTGAFLRVSDSVSATPEPATLSLLGIGLLAIGTIAERRKRKTVLKL
jgi:PEP-CTERM motif-containing protein